MKTVITLIALVGVLSPVFGQRPLDSGTPVTKTDLIFKLLADHQAKLKADCERDQTVRVHFSDWVEVNTPVGERLFPQLRFASISWTVDSHPAPDLRIRPNETLPDSLRL